MKLSILACLRAWICMSAQAKKEIHEIEHVIFIDIVGYSKLLINQQSEQRRELNEIVNSANRFPRV